MNAEMHGVAARLLITRDPDAEGAFRVTCTRLGGDTFAYHEAFRQLRQLLGDAVQGGVPLNKLGLSKLQQSSSEGGSSSGLGGRGRAPPSSASRRCRQAAAARARRAQSGGVRGRRWGPVNRPCLP